MGQLAGGIAHDFNNLLMIISGSSELLSFALSVEHPQRVLVDEIQRAAERGASLTQQLLAFSRRQMVRVQPLDLNQQVLATCSLLRRLIGEDILLQTHLEPTAGIVLLDPGQMEQILINLVVNARDAMPQGGTLTIATTARFLERAADLLPASAQPGWYTQLIVSDTGIGIPNRLFPFLFEPFFTTKQNGLGTGLGLATVHGIVGQAGGFVTVQSQVDKGSIFVIHLPRQNLAVPEVKPISKMPANESFTLPTGSGERILLVEDDPGVRQLLTTFLIQLNYEIWTAVDASSALALWNPQVPLPDLLLTDVVIPGMSGRRLAELLRRKHPDLKVLFMSGHTTDTVLRHGVAQDRVSFMQKPFDFSTLALKVWQTLRKN